MRSLPAVILICVLLGVACAASGRERGGGVDSPVKRDMHEAIARGLAWIEANSTLVDPAATILLERLKSRFGVEVDPALKDRLLRNSDAPELDEIRPYLRLIDPNLVLDPATVSAPRNGVDALTLPALWCDRVPLPGEHLAALDAALAQGGYEATHAALALTWIDELDCLPEAEVDPLKEKAGSAIAAIAASQSATDLGIEAALMLHYTGHGNEVDPVWVSEILASQNPDGGWPPEPGEASSSHTTALALWLLSEEAAEGKAPTAWIPSAPDSDG